MATHFFFPNVSGANIMKLSKIKKHQVCVM